MQGSSRCSLPREGTTRGFYIWSPGTARGSARSTIGLPVRRRAINRATKLTRERFGRFRAHASVVDFAPALGTQHPPLGEGAADAVSRLFRRPLRSSVRIGNGYRPSGWWLCKLSRRIAAETGRCPTKRHWHTARNIASGHLSEGIAPLSHELASANSTFSLASAGWKEEEDAAFNNERWRCNGSNHVGFMGEGLRGHDDETLGSSVRPQPPSPTVELSTPDRRECSRTHAQTGGQGGACSITVALDSSGRSSEPIVRLSELCAST